MLIMLRNPKKWVTVKNIIILNVRDNTKKVSHCSMIEVVVDGAVHMIGSLKRVCGGFGKTNDFLLSILNWLRIYITNL